MSDKKSELPSRRSNVARGMILAGTGKRQIFKDRRSKRGKDYKNSWKADQSNS